MSNALTLVEKAKAWVAAWQPSFVGYAIVSKDFLFLDVNQQFCDIVGVTQGELIGKSFVDITPHPWKEIDVTNATLLQKGIVRNYVLPKKYAFADGKSVSIVLLVSGVYEDPPDDAFLFYVAQIIEDVTPQTLDSSTPEPKSSSSWIPAWFDVKKIAWLLFMAVVAAIAVLLEKYLKLK